MKTEKTRKEILDSLNGLYETGAVAAGDNGKEIFRAKHTGTGQVFLIKSLAESLPVYGFLCGIKCANLPEVYEIYECPDGVVLIEEYVEGELLSSYLSHHTPKYREAKLIVAQLCGVLSFLHENGYVHRDIKPENIILCGDTVKLIDFDAARVYDTEKTSDTRVLGTVGYASPEQFGMAQSDGRVDVYALGVLLNVMLTGDHPSKKLAGGRAGRIVLKCTQINPDLRYQTVEKLAAAL